MFRIAIIFISLFLSNGLIAMSLDEVLSLKSYYLEHDYIVERKIGEIEGLIKRNPADPLLYLAKTTLLTILASNSTTPDADLANRMIQNLEIFQSMEPENPFGIIYKAAALAYEAKASHYLFNQIALINEASANFDRGIKLMEGSEYEWWARSMRGSSYAQFPLALGKRSIAMNDLAYVEISYKQNPALIGEAIVAFYYLGELNASLGKMNIARAYWLRAAQLNQGSNLAEGRKAEARVRGH